MAAPTMAQLKREAERVYKLWQAADTHHRLADPDWDHLPTDQQARWIQVARKTRSR